MRQCCAITERVSKIRSFLGERFKPEKEEKIK